MRLLRFHQLCVWSVRKCLARFAFSNTFFSADFQSGHFSTPYRTDDPTDRTCIAVRTFSKKANLQFRQRSGGYRVTGIPILCTLGDPRTRSKAEWREWRGKDRGVEVRRRRYEKCVTPADALRPWEIRLGYRIVIAAGYRSSPSRNGRPDRCTRREKNLNGRARAQLCFTYYSPCQCCRLSVSILSSCLVRNARRRVGFNSSIPPPPHYLFLEPLNTNDNKRFLNPSNDWDKYPDDNTINRLYKTGVVFWRITLFSFFSHCFRSGLVEKTNTKPITCENKIRRNIFFRTVFDAGNGANRKYISTFSNL